VRIGVSLPLLVLGVVLFVVGVIALWQVFMGGRLGPLVGPWLVGTGVVLFVAGLACVFASWVLPLIVAWR
jgi:hypothetical protein